LTEPPSLRVLSFSNLAELPWIANGWKTAVICGNFFSWIWSSLGFWDGYQEQLFDSAKTLRLSRWIDSEKDIFQDISVLENVPVLNLQNHKAVLMRFEMRRIETISGHRISKGADQFNVNFSEPLWEALKQGPLWTLNFSESNFWPKSIKIFWSRAQT
jgi:hypothetical protein